MLYLVMNSTTGHYDIYAKVKGDDGTFTMELLDDTTVDLSGYVQKETGKSLMTDAERTKLSGIDLSNVRMATDDEVTSMLTSVFGS